MQIFPNMQKLIIQKVNWFTYQRRDYLNTKACHQYKLFKFLNWNLFPKACHLLPLYITQKQPASWVFSNGDSVEADLSCLFEPIEMTKETMFYSQPMTCEVPICGEEEANRKDVIMGRLRDKLFHSFKAWSGRSERQLTRIIGNSHESEPDILSQNLQKIMRLFPLITSLMP